MQRMKHRIAIQKILLLFLCTLICFSCFACSKKAEPIPSTEEELRSVGTVGEYTIPYEELRFAILTCRAMLEEKYGADFLSEQGAVEQIRADVYDNITYNYAILTLCREVGILQDDPKLLEKVQQTIEQTVEELGSRKKYEKYLEENGMTDHFFRFNTLVDLMQNELYYVYRDDLGLIATDYEVVYNKIRREFASVSHIYISAESENAEHRIAEAYEKLEGGADFDSVLAEYGEDTELPSEGYYIPKGYMTQEYEDVAFSLELRAYSEVLRVGDGYYIICRRPISTEYVMMNYETLKKRYQDYAFLAMIEKAQEELAFVPNSYGESLNYLTLS